MCCCDGAVGVHQLIAGVILGREKEITSISLAPDKREADGTRSCVGPDCLCASMSVFACLLFNPELSEYFVPPQNIFRLN